jgi:hypothetical protein
MCFYGENNLLQEKIFRISIDFFFWLFTKHKKRRKKRKKPERYFVTSTFSTRHPIGVPWHLIKLSFPYGTSTLMKSFNVYFFKRYLTSIFPRKCNFGNSFSSLFICVCVFLLLRNNFWMHIVTTIFLFCWIKVKAPLNIMLVRVACQWIYSLFSLFFFSLVFYQLFSSNDRRTINTLTSRFWWNNEILS